LCGTTTHNTHLQVFTMIAFGRAISFSGVISVRFTGACVHEHR